MLLSSVQIQQRVRNVILAVIGCYVVNSCFLSQRLQTLQRPAALVVVSVRVVALLLLLLLRRLRLPSRCGVSLVDLVVVLLLLDSRACVGGVLQRLLLLTLVVLVSLL